MKRILIILSLFFFLLSLVNAQLRVDSLKADVKIYLPVGGLQDSTVQLSDFTTAAYNFISSGGKIENHADDLTIVENPDSTLSVSSIVAKKTDISDSLNITIGTKTITNTKHNQNLGFVTIKDYDFTCDGITDNRTKFLSAISDAKASNSKTLYLGADTFYVSGIFDVSGLKIDGHGTVIRGDGLSSDGLLYAYGDTLSGGTVLSEDAKKGDQWIKSSLASSISQGDLLKIMSNEDYDAISKSTMGEMHLVDYVSGTTIYLSSHLNQTYKVDSSASVYKMGYTTFDISGVTIILPEVSTGSGIVVKRALFPRIQVTVLRAQRDGIRIADCYGAYVNSVCTNTDNNTAGYGISIYGGMYGRITGTYVGAWHAVSFGAIDNQPWGYKVFNATGAVNVANSDTHPFDAHAGLGSVEFINCTAYGAKDSVLSTVLEWAVGTAYTSGDTVYASDYNYYIAQGSTTGDDPTTDYDQTNWAPISVPNTGGSGFTIRGGSATITGCKAVYVDAILETYANSAIGDLIVENTQGRELYRYGIVLGSGTSIQNLIVRNVSAYSQSFRRIRESFLTCSASNVVIGNWIFENIDTKNMYGFDLEILDCPSELVISNYTGYVDTTKYRPATLDYNLKCGKQSIIKLLNWNLTGVGNVMEYGDVASPVTPKKIVIDNMVFSDKSNNTGNIVYLRTDVEDLYITNSYFSVEPGSSRRDLVYLSTGKTIDMFSFTNNTLETPGEGWNDNWVSMITNVFDADSVGVYYFYQTGNTIERDLFGYYSSVKPPKVEIINGSMQRINYCKADTIFPQGLWKVGDVIIERDALADSTMGWICTTAGASTAGAWSSGGSYVKGDQVLDGATVYRALADGGEAEDPSSDTNHTFWYRVYSLGNTEAVFKRFGVIY